MSELVFEKYEIIRRLAIGGMGEIFLARQLGIPGFERLVILKNLLSDLAQQENFIEEFLDEARVAATLNHPNVVAIYEVGLWEGSYFIAMEYVHGVTLAQLMTGAVERGLGVPPQFAARIVHDAARGLAHAHATTDTQGNPLGIIHRDISPQNIMVRKDGVTKVLDFGIAKAANRATRTATGHVKGKLAYMAPEQISEGALDGRVDQFALGTVFWELCASQRLFAGANAVQTMQKLLNEPTPRLADTVPDFSPQLDAVVDRMLQRDPDDRYDSMNDVVDDIRDYLDTLPTGTEPSMVAPFVAEVCGEQIDAATMDITPNAGNYVIPLSSGTLSDVHRRQGGSFFGSLFMLIAAAALAVVGSDQVSKRFFAGPSAAELLAQAAATTTEATLEIKSKPRDAAVMIGTRSLGRTPVTLTGSLEAGIQHILSIEKPGFLRADLVVKLDPGESKSRAITLREAPKPPEKEPPAVKPKAKPVTKAPAKARRNGSLSVQTRPWTNVYVGTRFLGETPFFKVALPVGSHQLRFVNDGIGIDETRTIKVRPGRETKFLGSFD